MMTIVVLFANYGPYHVARVGAVAKFYQQFSQTVIGVELARQEQEYPWDVDINNTLFKLHSLFEETALEKISTHRLCIRVWQLLTQLNPNAVAIAGYSRLPMLTALFWCKWHHRIAILMSETTERDFNREIIQEKVKSTIVRNFNAALVGGKPHARYLVKLGMDSEAIYTGYDVVENSKFHPSKIRCLPIPINQPYFLSINRFVNKKNLPFLISAYVDYQNKTTTPWHLILCGDGELRPQLESLIEQNNLQDFIHLPGFLQQDELLPYFAHAKCFIHASTTEQWGLVVNEAMAAGLPVLVSNCCGCFEDLVIEGVNGFGFNPEYQEELTNLMLKISSREVDLEAMGQASLVHIQRFSPHNFAQGLKNAFEFAFNKERNNRSF